MRNHHSAVTRATDARRCPAVHALWAGAGRSYNTGTVTAFRVTVVVTIVAGALAAACRARPGDPLQPPERSGQQPPSFVDTAWVSTDPGAPLGTIRIFLADGTLVMDSCFETYRLARWVSVDARRIAWEEDTARIEADVDDSAAGQLRLRLHLVQETREERYRLATVPFVCPDLRAASSGP